MATGPTTVKAVRPASFSVSTTAKYFLEHQDAPAEICETGFPAAKHTVGCPGDLTPSTHTYRLFRLLKSGAWKERRGEARLYLRSGPGQQPAAAFPCWRSPERVAVHALLKWRIKLARRY